MTDQNTESAVVAAMAKRPVAKDSDVVYTPDWIVCDMLSHFAPSGVVLDPCRGEGAFHKRLPDGSPWCEVAEGRDFFDWTEPVDWVVGNPPYSITRGWFRHSFTVAENLLYLVPVRNVTSAYGFLSEIRAYGGIVAVRLYGTGSRCGFPMGNAIAAVHVQRSYGGPTTWTDQQVDTGDAWHLSALVGRSKFRHTWMGQQTACGRGFGGHLRRAYSDDPPCPQCLALPPGTLTSHPVEATP